MRPLLINATFPAQLRDEYRRKQPAIAELVRLLAEQAEHALTLGPFTVTDKKFIPPSRDKRDYTSLSRYYWPNPYTPDGLPYVRRDGETNPEFNLYDRPRIGEFSTTVRLLLVAYYFTGDERFIKRAVLLLEVWFVNPNTAMNPRMNFADYIPGRLDGKPSGILNTRLFMYVFDAFALLDIKQAWYEELGGKLKAWISTYLKWLSEDTLAKQEQACFNNHGTWFDVQYLYYLYYLGKEKKAEEYITSFSLARIDYQFDEAGFQPNELKRTLSLMYSEFNLDAWCHLAMLARPRAIVTHSSRRGRSITQGLKTALPYLLLEKPWPFPQIKEFKPLRSFPVFTRVYELLELKEFYQAAFKVDQIVPLRPVTKLLYSVPDFFKGI